MAATLPVSVDPVIILTNESDRIGHCCRKFPLAARHGPTRTRARAPFSVLRRGMETASMELRFTARRSDSPWVDVVWTCTSDQVSEMTSVAATRCGLVFWEREGRPHAGVSGPETAAGTAPVPEGATFVGIEFAIGTSLRNLPSSSLTDGGVELPDTTRRSFQLAGSSWETPGPDDAEALVEHLVRDGVVARDPIVAEVMRGGRPQVSDRTLERRFRAATGLTRGAVRQIERAREAAHLLAAGKGTPDVVASLGYFDQPHLARALRRYIGCTATQLHDGGAGAIALDLPQPTTS
jgi:hypothetical protein